MEQFNKVISFVLGLVVVVIFLAVATGKINLKGKLPTFSGASSSKSITPTPTKKASSTMTLNQTTQTSQGTQTKGGIPVTNSTTYRSYNSVGSVSNIPSTGPELLLPLAVSTFLGGSFLRRSGKKS
jgi:hypothetical protein